MTGLTPWQLSNPSMGTPMTEYFDDTRVADLVGTDSWPECPYGCGAMSDDGLGGPCSGCRADDRADGIEDDDDDGDDWCFLDESGTFARGYRFKPLNREWRKRLRLMDPFRPRWVPWDRHNDPRYLIYMSLRRKGRPVLRLSYRVRINKMSRIHSAYRRSKRRSR